jgi:hypothetical protein
MRVDNKEQGEPVREPLSLLFPETQGEITFFS